MKKIIHLCVVLTFGFLSSGCATIVHGTTTKVNFTSEPPGAIVKVGNESSTTPATIRIKNNTHYTAEFRMDGYRPSIVYLDQAMSGWIWGNVLLGGIIGVCIDMASGGAYKVGPKDVHAVLELQSKVLGTNK